MGESVTAVDLPAGSMVLHDGRRWTKLWETPGGEWQSSLGGITGDWWIGKLLDQHGGRVLRHGYGDEVRI